MWFKIVTLLACHRLSISQDTPIRDRNKKPYKLVCFFGSWILQDPLSNFTLGDIDPFQCTHLIYAFANLAENNTIVPIAPDEELEGNSGQGIYKEFNNLKQRNPELTTLIAIGGWFDSSIKYSNMSSDNNSRAVFVNSVLSFLQRHNFDGLDMSWDYPAHRGGLPEDKENFILLLKDLNESLKPFGYLLSATVACDPQVVEKAYNVPGIAENVDFINLMAYDYDYGYWGNYTSHIAPLYGRPDEQGLQKTYNANYTVTHWLELGAPARKLVLGIPIYGRLYTLQDVNQTEPGSPVVGNPKNLPFNKICLLLNEDGWVFIDDEVQKSFYTSKDTQWITANNALSLESKIEYMEKMGLGGIMASSIELDDFQSKCFRISYPFLSYLSQQLASRQTLHHSTEDNFYNTTVLE